MAVLTAGEALERRLQIVHSPLNLSSVSSSKRDGSPAIWTFGAPTRHHPRDLNLHRPLAAGTRDVCGQIQSALKGESLMLDNI